MARPFFIVLLAVGVAGGIYASRHHQLDAVSGWAETVWKRAQGQAKEDLSLAQDALSVLNRERLASQLHAVDTDNELARWLNDHLAKKPDDDLGLLLAAAQKECPRYLRVAAFSTQGLRNSDLISEVSQWRDGLGPTYTHAAAVSQSAFAHLGIGLVLMVAERLPNLSPEVLNSTKQTEFFSVCAHCGNGHLCEITSHQCSISLECPRCHRVYAMLAGDSEGNMHYVNEFLTGYQPPAHFPRTRTPIQEAMIIWRAVGQICHYTQDPKRGADDAAFNDPLDAWQTALQTQVLQTGDCEDSAIMLTDWLVARGFEARVAVGRYSERGGHAWVVLRLEGKEYLLESTHPDQHSDRPPLAVEVGARYIPDAMFDRDALYVRRDTGELWDGDYWSNSKWLRVAPRVRPDLKNKALAVTQSQASRVGPP